MAVNTLTRQCEPYDDLAFPSVVSRSGSLRSQTDNGDDYLPGALVHWDDHIMVKHEWCWPLRIATGEEEIKCRRHVRKESKSV